MKALWRSRARPMEGGGVDKDPRLSPRWVSDARPRTPLARWTKWRTPPDPLLSVDLADAQDLSVSRAQAFERILPRLEPERDLDPLTGFDVQVLIEGRGVERHAVISLVGEDELEPLARGHRDLQGLAPSAGDRDEDLLGARCRL